MIVKDGEEYVKVDNCKVNVKIVELQMNFEQLFKRDKVLSDLGNSLVNQNVDLFIKDVEPSLETSLGKRYTYVCVWDLHSRISYSFSENIPEVSESSFWKSSDQSVSAMKSKKLLISCEIFLEFSVKTL